jgi:hypothetical protein
MRFCPIVKVAFPGLVIAAVCLCPTTNPAQDSQAIRVDTRTGAPLLGQVADPTGNAIAQRPIGAITLDPPTGLDLQAHTLDSKGNTLPEAPANFRRLGQARVGEVADLHTLTLRFSQTTRITGISISKDFKIEQGGSCVQGNTYQKGSTCRMLVRFTPQGPGNRLGHLSVSHTASPTPDSFGLGGIGYSPALSFIPSVITTVPGTYPSGVGLLNNAQSLAIDGGDILYIADFGNDQLRQIDSSGVITSVTPFTNNPLSIAVDTVGEVWGVGASGSQFYLSVDYPWGATAFGYTYTDSTCTPSAPCAFNSVGMRFPAQISIDSYNNLFMEEDTTGALEMPVASYASGNSALNLWHLADRYAYWVGNPGTFAVNPTGQSLFTFFTYSLSNTCYILAESLYGAEYNNASYTRVAGANTCGFSGDGGLAAGAKIGSAIGQFAFDAAGDLYFTDTNNQRVRRIDYTTGIIRTIAGNGTAGYVDSSSALKAELDNPTGVSVDSQGQVYIISGTGTGSAQVVRKVGNAGYATMGSIVVGATSPPQTVVLTNTGNSSLVINNAVFGGTNPSEFSVDPGTTSCALTAGSVLTTGQSCQIGFVLKPAGTGARRGTFTITDNTANFSNLINVSGTGILPSAMFKIISPTKGASFTSGTSVTYKASVAYGSSPAPTGTVQFKVDGTNYGSAVTISSGVASITVTGLSTASHTLSATYSGDSHYAAGRPISVTITVTASIAKKPL